MTGGGYDLSFHLGILGDQHELEKVDTLVLKNGLDQVVDPSITFDVEEHYVAQMQFSNGLKYYWERASNAHMEVPNETRIYGTKGGLKLGFCTWDAPTIELYYISENGQGTAQKETITVDMEGCQDDQYELMIHFIDMLEGAQPALSMELKQKHFNIIQACYEATEHKYGTYRTIEYPPNQ